MKNRLARLLPCIALFLAFAPDAGAALREAHLTISEQPLTIAGRTTRALTVNGGVPGPTLTWTVGDRIRIHVHNTLDVTTSVHWHGILLPNRQDGVPGLTTPPIAPGATHTFEFSLRHSGTYWYHSHTGLQEQRGVYGAIVIHPRTPDVQADRDFVLVLSDWTSRSPHEVLRLLKRGSHAFALEKGTAQSLWGALRAGAFGHVLRNSLQRMPPMDVSDVAYDAFLSNGRPEAEVAGRPGERLRVRIVNAAASTYFYLALADGPLRVVAADGPAVEPIEVPRLLMAVAETYDVLVTLPESGALELRATAQDGSGSTSVWLGSGERRAAAPVPPPDLYRLHAEEHHAHGGGSAPAPPHGAGAHRPHGTPSPAAARPPAPYRRLRAPEPTAPADSSPRRDLRLTLTGDMERYTWSFDGRTLSEVDVIPVRRGEVLRIALVNRTMMHHPIHLHGHFFRVLKGAGAHAPLKHTVDVAPMDTTVIEFLADADKEWFFHCHVLYHMKAGMARIFRYEGSEPDADLRDARRRLLADPVYPSAAATASSHFTEGALALNRTRHELRTEWEIGWQSVDGVEHEVQPLYRYHFDRFYRALAGGSLESERDAAVFGVEALLPFLFEGRAWVDTDGEGRFALAREWALTARLHAVGDVEYDTRQKFEGRAGLRWELGHYAALAFDWHSEFGFGGGLELRF
ncbi:MAG: multicopper oxidase domain-containing protein [Proteobacteria bacterium]|nr:multicopper oxidase domain-containing protein [Pseudomonadota bacterium]